MLQHVSSRASTAKNLNYLIKKNKEFLFHDQMESDMLFISNIKRDKPSEWKEMKSRMLDWNGHRAEREKKRSMERERKVI